MIWSNIKSVLDSWYSKHEVVVCVATASFVVGFIVGVLV